MPDIALPIRPVFVIALGVTCLAIGLYARGNDHDEPSTPVQASESPQVSVPRAAAVPVLDRDTVDDEPEPIDDELHGHASIDDPAEFAFLFDLDGVTYVQLSTDERATSTGRPKLSHDGDVYSVVAKVETTAMPAQF